MLFQNHTPQTIPMYTAIHHDRRNSKIFLYYADGARMAYESNHRLFTPNFGEYGSVDSGMTDIYGKPVYSAVVTGEKEMEIREINGGPDNQISECDIDYRTRFLQNHYKDVKELRFNIKDFNICFLDIEVESGNRFPTAERADRRVNCVTIYLSKPGKYITFGLQKPLKPETLVKLAEMNAEYRMFQTEKDLITNLFTTIGESGCDILSSWNGQFYDNPYLAKRAEGLGIDLRLLSRLPFKHRSVYIDKRDRSLKIAGTEVIDYLILYKKFSNKEKDNYRLSTIGKLEVGEDKAPLPDGYQSYKNYWDEYVLYNIKDVELLVKIDAKRKMLESLIGACSEARIPFSHFFEAKKILVGFLMDFLHKRNMVMPPLKLREKKKFPGAAVFSTSGRYLDLVSYDYKSMYPSLIMGANISPEMKVEFDIDYKLTPEEEQTLVKSPWTNWNTKQVYYRRDKEGIVPAVVRILFEGRDILKKEMKRAKKEGRDNDAAYYGMKEQSYKLLGNSLYGLLGNEHFQLFDLDNAAAVTGYGYLLITNTITDLSNYFENDFENDSRYLEAFKESPTLNKKYLPKTTFSRGDTDEIFNIPTRFSHGDTDSFFVKYDDIYSVYEDKVGKHISVMVVNKNKVISENIYNLPDDEQDSKIDFNNQCKSYFPSWKELEKDVKVKAFTDGMYSENDITVIYNRYSLTDYCRILDMIIMKDNLSGYMQKFADKWNFIRNTLFLKREKCILKAIVAKKKKYICIVESNEDVKYKEPEFQTVGLEIIRSDTTPFSRERLLTLVKLLLHNLDKVDMRTKYMTAKKEFFNLVKKKDVYSISKPSGVGSEPPQYTEMITWPIEKRKEVDWRLRSGSVWNHLIETDPILSAMTLEPISDGTKAKFIDVHENKYGLNSIAYVGETCPSRLLELFNPDWNSQWSKTFGDKMGRLFEAVGWSKDFENDTRDFMASVF